MKLTKNAKKLNKYNQINMLSISLMATYGECSGSYTNCGGGSTTYSTCTGNYITCK